MREHLDDLMLWSGSRRDATDDRVRFSSVSAGGNIISLLMRNLQVDLIREGERRGDWVITCVDPGHPERRWTGQSDSYTGAVLNMIARRCGLAGEIRGDLPDNDEEQP